MTPRLCLLSALFLLAAPSARAEDAAPATDAASLWTARCQSCHGADGRAQTRLGQKEHIPDFSRPRWQKAESDAELRRVIANGSRDNPKMKAYKDRLTPEQMDALVRHIRTLEAKGEAKDAAK